MLPTECWSLPDGTRLTLRPVLARDAPSLNELIEGLPARDRRWRFHGAVNGVIDARLERMACIDPRHELALVVTTSALAGEAVIADARCVVDSSGHDAEFALMVAAGWRRRAIGERALGGLRRAAASRGLHWLYGSVLADNAPMLALLRRCGFHCAPQRGDASRITVEANLQTLDPGHT